MWLRRHHIPTINNWVMNRQTQASSCPCFSCAALRQLLQLLRGSHRRPESCHTQRERGLPLRNPALRQATAYCSSALDETLPGGTTTTPAPIEKPKTKQTWKTIKQRLRNCPTKGSTSRLGLTAMDIPPQQNQSKSARILFIGARIIVGLIGLLMAILGSSWIWRAAIEGTPWWGWAVAVAFFTGGSWFVWSAVKPHRENVHGILEGMVSRILEELIR
jgi:hypothetical protein